MKKLLVHVIFLTLLMIGSVKVNAHQWEVHHRPNGEIFELLQISSPRKPSLMESYVDNLRIAISSLNDPFLRQLNYKKSIKTIHCLSPNHLLLIKDSANPRAKRSIKVSKIGKQFIIGELYGVGTSLVGGIVGGALAPKDAGLGTISYGLVGMYFGYTLGVSFGVYIGGNNSEENGSYLATLSGSIIGALCGIKIFFDFNQKGFGSYVLILGPPIGSMIGFNLFLKPRESSGSAFINYYQGRLKWSLGKINVHYDRYYKPILNLNLFQANF